MPLLSVQLVYKYNLWLVVEYLIFIYLLKMRRLSSKNIEFRNIKEVIIQSSNDKKCKILFDKNHSIEDKILNEQFEY